MSTFAAQPDTWLENYSLAFMFGHDIIQTCQTDHEGQSQGLRLSPTRQISNPFDACLSQDKLLFPVDEDSTSYTQYTANIVTWQQYDQHCVLEAGSRATGTSSDAGQNMQYPQSPLQQTQSALTYNLSSTTVPVDQPMPAVSSFSQRPRSAPLTMATDPPKQPPVTTQLHIETSHTKEMLRWGYRVNSHGGWACSFPQCRSRKTFYRECDLRKHYKRHARTFYCRQDRNCPQATSGGFSTIKDRARHEASHNPLIRCKFEGCDRLFSRSDNMRDHYRRKHGALRQGYEGASRIPLDP